MTTALTETKINSEFVPNFSGPDGLFYLEKIKGSPPNSEVFIKNKKPELTNRRWVQFLDDAENLICSAQYRNNCGKVDIFKLAQDGFGFTVKPCEDPGAVLHQLKENPEYRDEFNGTEIPKEKERINGFSFPYKKEIFYKKSLKEGQKNFAVGHELSHYLLRHEGRVFYKSSSTFLDRIWPKINDNKKSYGERTEYNEEADKLAAILLMPHVYMQDLLNVFSVNLAARFGVTVSAIRKRKKEVDKEIKVLCYAPAPLKSLQTDGS